MLAKQKSANYFGSLYLESRCIQECYCAKICQNLHTWNILVAEGRGVGHQLAKLSLKSCDCQKVNKTLWRFSKFEKVDPAIL